MKSENRLLPLSIAALGVVFGDIGTSPLYAIKECFTGDYGIAPLRENILGILSLIFWTLLIIVTIKYVIFVLKADNEGEGGVMALTGLIKRVDPEKKLTLFVLLGIFAASMLYGDGMITPAISVLSAVGGLAVVAPGLKEFVLPVTIIILIGLFLIQSRGTEKVGSLFGPIIFLWFLTLAVLGLIQVVKNPVVFLALNPLYGFKFLLNGNLRSFIVLGAVFLVATGAEAMYADMGHFGRKPIRLTWSVVVFPSLVLNYFGQGAYLLSHPESAENIFFMIAPHWLRLYLLIIATLATIIASQAVITGSFSLTKQIIQMGYFPKMKLVHTSSTERGQIYVPLINWFLMLATIGLVLGFRTTSHLAAAYGVAVNFTMIVTTFLFYIILRRKFKWGLLNAFLLSLLFFVVELSFFVANLSKIMHGAWFPLVVGGVFYVIMRTWEKGRMILREEFKKITMDVEEFKDMLEKEDVIKVNGYAVFMTGRPDVVPFAMIQNVRHNRIIHSTSIILHIKFETIPRVPNLEKVELEKLGNGIFRVIARVGYMEDPDVGKILELATASGLDVPLENVSFFLGRERLNLVKNERMAMWRKRLFRFISTVSSDFSVFTGLPPGRVIEIGVELEL